MTCLRPPSAFSHEGWAQSYADEDRWHYFSGVGLYDLPALCKLPLPLVNVFDLIPDYIGDPQPNDCDVCRRELEELTKAGRAPAQPAPLTNPLLS